MGLGGLEPPTSRLSGVRSNQLSYRPTPQQSLPKRSSVRWHRFDPLHLPRDESSRDPSLAKPGGMN